MVEEPHYNTNKNLNSSKYNNERISLPSFGIDNNLDTHNKDSSSSINKENQRPHNMSLERLGSENGTGGLYSEKKERHRGSRDGHSVLRRYFSGDESNGIIGNPLQFSMNGDSKEQRYSSDEEAHEDEMPFAGDRSREVPPRNNRSQSFPSGHLHEPDIRKGHTKPQEADNKLFKAKKRLQQFGRKIKPKEKDAKKQERPFPLEHALMHEDQVTAERAEKMLSTLLLGYPSMCLFASCLLADESGVTRSPLLLNLLGFNIMDISRTYYTRNRKFRFDLEYGVWPQRMKWSVERSAKDLLYLHSRFKLDNWRNEMVRTKSSELPKFPIPHFRKGLSELPRSKTKAKLDPNKIASTGSNSFIENEDTDVNAHNDDSHSLHSFGSLMSGHSLRDQLSHIRQHLSAISSITSEGPTPEQIRIRLQRNQEYLEEVRQYLNNLIDLLSLKPQSNKLFQFFEISPISSLLSYETGYIGKQGIVHIGGTAKSQGWRVGHFRANDVKGMIDRRSEKWLLVRGLYIIYVSDINSTSPLEVFLVDSKFKISNKEDEQYHIDNIKEDDESEYDVSSTAQKALVAKDAAVKKAGSSVFKHLKITLENSERKLILIPKSRKEQRLWLKSLNEMKNSTVWSEPHRFQSFAPIRENCFAQWFVDGRDYFWAISSALEMAKDVIFIHDWWLSPELYLRRPANGNQQWRIDRILQRKAHQGVKIFVIVYRNVGTTVATDSLYTKHSLLSLNEDNIHVIRSPNQLLQNTYFWAHHEKLCVIDQSIAFMGGIDLCYGRYDTPDHVLVDDSKVDFEHISPEFKPEDVTNFQTFPGKDYSNPRVKDFSSLDKPYESMYDRNTTPRMPWHDVHMVMSGKAVRDLARHFVQRWNYLIRQKRPSRLTPLLTPPPDFTDEEIRTSGLNGSCQIQLLRSAGSWSLGLKEHEQSIQNAYLKLIETSEHFIYMENQFFITSCIVDNNEIQNRVGDAIVDRIIRAHKERRPWKAIVVIPLMPGFQAQVDEPDGSSVRVIMQCQYMSISRHSTSIFAKLRKYGIEPEDYIQFFSLRKWGIIGPDRNLITEQLYVHAKTMIVDDRVAIIGSANINERSLRGSRDSEVAAIIVDKETVKSKMNGEDYFAANFAFTLRKRLMREHLGVGIDILDLVERRFKRFEDFAKTEMGLNAATNIFSSKEGTWLSAMVEIASRDILDEPEGTERWMNFREANNLSTTIDISESEILDYETDDDKSIPSPLSLPVSFNNRTGQHEANRGIRDKKKHSYDPRVQQNDDHKRDVLGVGKDKYKTKLSKWARLNSNAFLKDMAKKSMSEDHKTAFLPDMENIVKFLNANDHDIFEKMDEESEAIITERNRERWVLLKKVSYLQRIAARARKDAEEESKKRVSACMKPSVFLQTIQKTFSASSKKEKVVDDTGSPKLSSDDTAIPISNGIDSNVSSLQGSGAEKKETHNSDMEHVGNIPVVSLTENDAKGIMDSVCSGGMSDRCKFIDPYAFDDPLAVEFYDDMFYETARRNSELYRLVFHCQPDNTVLTWKDYKHFSRLNDAFQISQQREAKKRRQRALYKSGEVSQDYNLEDSETDDADDSLEDSASIYESVAGNRDGLLGRAPPSSDNSDPILSGIKRANPNDGDHEDSKFQNANVSTNFNESENTPELQYQKDANGENGFEDHAHLDVEEKRPIVLDSPQHPDTNTFPTSRGKAFSTRRKIAMGERVFERESAERLLQGIQGNLVIFPSEWLSQELEARNWFYNTDRIPPIDIYD